MVLLVGYLLDTVLVAGFGFCVCWFVLFGIVVVRFWCFGCDLVDLVFSLLVWINSVVD